MLRLLTLPLACAWLLGGCGAFADAAREDGGGGEQLDSDLSFFVGEEERETLRQGQVEAYRIVFDSPPPWTSGEGGYAYRTRFDFMAGGEQLQDINHVITSYDGLGTLEVILGAERAARTGERELYVDLAYEKAGQPQRLHRGVGKFYVLPATAGPDGGDAADGGGDP